MNIEFPDELLRQMWNDVDWALAEEKLRDQQAQLSKAAFRRDMAEITRLQKRIVRDHDIKCLAVRHVVRSTSGPGIDGVRWSKPEEMMRAALSLTSKDYHTQPFRQLLIIAKNTGKQRRPAIPTYYDRAMMVLYGYSFIPVAEAWADRKSFAFRRGRSTQDAQAYIFEALKGDNAPDFVVCADIRTFYATIQHSWLLKNVPMDKYVLSEFLNAGLVFAGELFPSEGYGISEGSNISPYLGNFVLDGLQEHIYRGLYGNEPPSDYANGNLIRFADDVFVTVRTMEDAQKVLSLIRDFLDERGLKLSPEKTHISSLTDGFTILSQTYIRKNGHLYCYPSDAAVERFIRDIRETTLSHSRSQRDLIKLLNSKLKGFASYHRNTDAEAEFRRIDTAVQTALLDAAFAKHPKMARQKVIAKYWYREHDGQHFYALPEDKSVRVIHLSDTLLIRHRKVKTNVNPFLDIDYVESRTHQRQIENVTGPYRAVWDRQDGCCYYCGRPILTDQPRTVVQLDLSHAPSVKNSAYIHKLCAPNEFEIIHTMEDVGAMRPFDILSVLGEMSSLPPPGKRVKREITEKWRHIKLKQYFAMCTTATLTLTFAKMEKIDGRPFPKSARSNRDWWYPRKNCNAIAEAWLTEGYDLKTLDLAKEKATFTRLKTGYSKLAVPDVLTNGKLPDNAVFELQTYFDYIIKKYAL